MKLDEIKQLIATAHKPELRDREGMVYQLWENGEITLQKSGSLFGARTLHQITAGLDMSLPLDIMPVVVGVDAHRYGYAFVESKELADKLREQMAEVLYGPRKPYNITSFVTIMARGMNEKQLATSFCQRVLWMSNDSSQMTVRVKECHVKQEQF